MLLRIRNNVGLWRVEGLDEHTATVRDVLDAVAIDRPNTSYLRPLSSDPNGRVPLDPTVALSTQGVRHGDMIYCRVDEDTCGVVVTNVSNPGAVAGAVATAASAPAALADAAGRRGGGGGEQQSSPAPSPVVPTPPAAAHAPAAASLEAAETAAATAPAAASDEGESEEESSDPGTISRNDPNHPPASPNAHVLSALVGSRGVSSRDDELDRAGGGDDGLDGDGDKRNRRGVRDGGASTSVASDVQPSTPAPPASVPDPGPATAPFPPPDLSDGFPEEMVDNLTSMGFPRAEVLACLGAARGNPDLAVEFLTNGIPGDAHDGATPPPPAVPPASGADVRRSGGVASPRLQALWDHPQLDALRRLVQANPRSLQAVLTQIGRQQPDLLREINENPAAFLAMMNEPVASDAPTRTADPSASFAPARAGGDAIDTDGDGERKRRHIPDRSTGDAVDPTSLPRSLSGSDGDGKDDHTRHDSQEDDGGDDAEAKDYDSDDDDETPTCRICLGDGSTDSSSPPDSRLISPCLCRGTMGHVHVSCLQAWRRSAHGRATSSLRCDQCGHAYDVRRTSLALFLMSDAGAMSLAGAALGIAMHALGAAGYAATGRETRLWLYHWLRLYSHRGGVPRWLTSTPHGEILTLGGTAVGVLAFAQFAVHRTWRYYRLYREGVIDAGGFQRYVFFLLAWIYGEAMQNGSGRGLAVIGLFMACYHSYEGAMRRAKHAAQWLGETILEPGVPAAAGGGDGDGDGDGRAHGE